MKFALKQRLVFIECMLDHYGYINRSLLMDFFAIGIVQASSDIQTYLKIAPTNMVYNKNKKAYVRDIRFKKVFD